METMKRIVAFVVTRNCSRNCTKLKTANTKRGTVENRQWSGVCRLSFSGVFCECGLLVNVR